MSQICQECGLIWNLECPPKTWWMSLISKITPGISRLIGFQYPCKNLVGSNNSIIRPEVCNCVWSAKPAHFYCRISDSQFVEIANQDHQWGMFVKELCTTIDVQIPCKVVHTSKFLRVFQQSELQQWHRASLHVKPVITILKTVPQSRLDLRSRRKDHWTARRFQLCITISDI